ncbi:dihydropteroate synthase [Agrococcus casei]|uniref:7,8-dihydroneopterin aldolase n=1 Tax=Agrococcus casei LMG 22410 TaxID=1255656 RepID=A0A1R4F8A5_9MICO|nr:dihydropteroate synthase [Agrococcus casei]SJM52091.1 Dihydropteroate synthase [Agrococcus casei LMG 22410]
MTEVWGILNVTPDSFSDGGRYVDAGAAIAHARRMRAQGADVIDIGGESTRPGATPLSAADELDRILPVVRALVDEGIRVSVDTVHATTAKAVIDAGAEIINDITAGEHDPEMLATVAATDARIVLMHSRGLDVLVDTGYDDVVTEVLEHLIERVGAAEAAGISIDRIIVDPGFGFSKDAHDNWRLLAGMRRLRSLGLPILVGTSRKRFLGDVLPEGADATERDAATAATSMLAAQLGAHAVRVHDVASTVAAIRVQHLVEEAADDHVDNDVAIRIEGVRAYGFHGVLAAERAVGQEFVVDVDLSGRFGRAVESDALADTVNYAEIAQKVVSVVEGEPVDLIEALAGRIADACAALPLVDAAHVTVHKPNAPVGVPFGDVAVSVSRLNEADWTL